MKRQNSRYTSIYVIFSFFFNFFFPLLFFLQLNELQQLMRIQQDVFRDHLNKEQIGEYQYRAGGIAPPGQQRRNNDRDNDRDRGGDGDQHSLSTFDGENQE